VQVRKIYSGEIHSSSNFSLYIYIASSSP